MCFILFLIIKLIFGIQLRSSVFIFISVVRSAETDTRHITAAASGTAAISTAAINTAAIPNREQWIYASIIRQTAQSSSCVQWCSEFAVIKRNVPSIAKHSSTTVITNNKVCFLPAILLTPLCNAYILSKVRSLHPGLPRRIRQCQRLSCGLSHCPRHRRFRRPYSAY